MGLRWALVGASDIAATRMIPAMRRLGHDVASVVGSDPVRVGAYAAAHGVGRAARTLDEAFDGVDAAYISSYNPLHAAQAREALQAGLHVVCEKPVTLDLPEAVALIDVADASGRVFAVNHHLPCAPAVRALERVVRAGELGDLLGLQLNHAVFLPERLRGWRLDDVPGAGVALDVTVHDAAVVDLLVGRAPSQVTAAAVRQGPWPKGAVDAAMATLRWGDDLLCQTYDAFTVRHGITSIVVHGTQGTATAVNALTQDPVGEVTVSHARGVRDVDLGPRTDLYETALSRFAAAVGGDGEPAVTGARGTQAVATALAVAEAAATGTAVDVVDVTALLASSRAARRR